MTFKKVLSAVMAGAMVLSMGMTAFATTDTPESGTEIMEGETGWEMEVGSSTYVPAIKVQVPQAVAMIVNPYRLDAKNEELGISSTSDKQIVSPVQAIKNLSEFDLTIGGTVSGFAPEGATLKSALPFTPAGTDGKVAKEAFINFGAKAGGPSAPTIEEDSHCDQHVVLQPATNDVGTTIPDITVDKKGDPAPNYYFAFYGQVQDAPTEPWTADDVFGAFMTFNFKASANAAGSGSGSGSGTTYAITSAACATGTFTVGSTASAGDAVTVTADSPTTAGQTATVTVTKDSDSSTVSVTDNSDGTFTFTMPAEAVTVTVAYA